MTSTYTDSLKYLLSLDEKLLARWFTLYFTHKVTAPFATRLGDRPSGTALPQMLSDMKKIGATPEDIEKFKAAMVKSIQDAIAELQPDDEADYVADLLDTVMELSLSNAVPFLVNLAKMENRFLEETKYGKFNLQAYLLHMIFSFPMKEATPEDKKVVKGIKQLCEDGIEDERYAHLCYHQLIRFDKHNGWKYLPKLVGAAIRNSNIDFSRSLRAFLDTVSMEECQRHLSAVVRELSHMFPAFETDDDRIPPLDFFLDGVVYAFAQGGKFLIYKDLILPGILALWCREESSVRGVSIDCALAEREWSRPQPTPRPERLKLENPRGWDLSPVGWGSATNEMLSMWLEQGRVPYRTAT